MNVWKKIVGHYETVPPQATDRATQEGFGPCAV